MDGDYPEATLLYQRLKEIPGYTWDLRRGPFHSSYDNWHFFGQQALVSDPRSTSASPSTAARSSPPSIPNNDSRPSLGPHTSSNSSTSIATAVNEKDKRPPIKCVVARVSTHALRLEREYRISKLIFSEKDTDHKHFVTPIEFVRFPSRRDGDPALVVSIFESPGDNYRIDLSKAWTQWKGNDSHPGAKKYRWACSLTLLWVRFRLW